MILRGYVPDDFGSGIIVPIINKMLSCRRDGAAGCVIVFAKSRRLELGDNILRTL